MSDCRIRPFGEATVPEELRSFARLWSLDRAKKESQLCALRASAVNKAFSVYFFDLHIRNYYQKVVFIFPK